MIKLTDLINERCLKEELFKPDAWKGIQRTKKILKKKEKEQLQGVFIRYIWDDK